MESEVFECEHGVLIHDDCFNVFPNIEDLSVDMVLCDLPYGTTQNKWDSVLPLDKLWKQWSRINRGVAVLFGQDKFSAKLMLSNENNHRYNLIWKKGERTSGFLNSKKMPLRNHEDILVFYGPGPQTYNPQMVLGKKAHSRGKGNLKQNNNYGKMTGSVGNTPNGELKYPKSILDFDRPHPPIHPTQKSVGLYEWLIKTYTNEGDLVFDNCAGSATTAIACINTGRKFLCIEKEREYFELSVNRIKQHGR